MVIRFGYVSLSKIEDKVTPNGTMTYKYYQTLTNKQKKLKLEAVTNRNINALFHLIKYNDCHDIHFYRITSNLIPLATHPDVLWDFSQQFGDKLKEIGQFIKARNMRIDMHPDQFNVLNSIHPHVVYNTRVNLEYHHQILSLMGLEEEQLILHIGGKTNGKDLAKDRFIKNFKELPLYLKKRIIIENDDKIFNIQDALEMGHLMNIPVVFDYHHHKCNSIEDIKPNAIFQSWENSQFIPKVHLSSSRIGALDRSHSDFIEFVDFCDLINILRKLNRDFDIMIEAKMKDVAMFKLIEDIKREKPTWNFTDKTTLKL